jgi:1-deoxy-D-xylulose-5-phosphate synthase
MNATPMTTTSSLSDVVLDAIADPVRLRAMTHAELLVASEHIRSFLVHHVSRRGGHLGPNLGVVELTMALHRVFNSPQDKILFDTGHQAYVHKILTGRRNAFASLRARNGLSGYPSQSESVHDMIENSHASAALSYAHGLSHAYSLTGQSDRAIAVVVGDGALTGGMCWEALNNLAGTKHPVVVVLNDNGRSYAPTAGALAVHLAALRDREASSDSREPTGAGGNFFTELGFTYIGPIDGHDVAETEKALLRARSAGEPVLVHCCTTKGKGYEPAEQDDRDCLHAVGPGEQVTGSAPGRTKATWTETFGAELVKLGSTRCDLVCITAAMLHPAGLGEFQRRFPERVIDVGIAEQHAVTAAAGMAMAGLHPVVAVYATFMNRAFDQVLMDVALHRLPVTFVLDRAGVTGTDGASHNGVWDLAAFSGVPGLRVAAPRDTTRLAELLREAVDIDSGPTMVRFPKSSVGDELEAKGRVGLTDILTGHGRGDVMLVGIGPMAGRCLAAAEILQEQGLLVTVADPRWVIPADPSLVELARSHRVVLTVEDGVRAGGAGALLAQAVTDGGILTPVYTHGVACRFLQTAERDQALSGEGLHSRAVAEAALNAFAAATAADAPLSACHE